MRREKLLTLSVIALLLLNITLLVFLFLDRKSHPHHSGNPDHRMHGPKHIIIKKLDFDEQQIKKYESIIPEHKNSIDSLLPALELAKKQYYQLVAGEEQQNSHFILEKIADLHKKIDSTNFNHFLKIKSICKPEQLDRFNNLSRELSELFSNKKRK